MSPTPEFTNMYTTISKEMADSLEESGQGWRIQGEFGLETKMMFWMIARLQLSTVITLMLKQNKRESVIHKTNANELKVSTKYDKVR